MTDVLRALLRRADEPDPVFAADELIGWLAGEREQLERLGLLAETTPAEAAACDSCGRDHVERVAWVDVPGRPSRAFLPCPVVGRAPVPLDRLRRWTVRVPNLARQVARAVAATGVVTERLPGRVWKLGVIRVGGRAWTGFLVAGLAGLSHLAARPSELRRPNTLLFVPNVLPSDMVRSFGTESPPVVTLADLLSLGETGLTADRLVLESALAPPTSTTTTPGIPAPVVSWSEVTLLVEERHVRVRVGTTERRVGLAEAGFADRRKAESPNQAWALLTKLARNNGTLASPDRLAVKSDALKRGMTRLRNTLQSLLEIDDDPFHPVGRGDRYRARFQVRATTGATFPTPAGATWDHVTLIEVAPRVIAVAVESEATGAVYSIDAAGGRWEAAVEAAERTARYPLAELGLTEPARNALLAVLRNAGTIHRADRDPGMLSLGKGLTRFLSIDEPPFVFRRGAWTARFEARTLVPQTDR